MHGKKWGQKAYFDTKTRELRIPLQGEVFPTCPVIVGDLNIKVLSIKKTLTSLSQTIKYQIQRSVIANLISQVVLFGLRSELAVHR